MFGKRKLTTADLTALILRGAAPEVFAPLLYEASMGKHYLQVGASEHDLAYKYGRTLKSVGGIMVFYKAINFKRPEDEYKGNVSRWIVLHTEVARGFMEAGGVKTVEDAVALPKHFNGSEELEKELIKIVMPLLVERRDILDFACALKTHTGLMVFAIALGYAPVNTFDEAIKAHREKLRKEEEEEASRRRNSSNSAF